MSAMSDLAAILAAASPTEKVVPTDGREVVRVDHYVDRGAGAPVDLPVPLVRVEVEEPGEGYRAAYLTVSQARALAAALHVAAYRATSEAQGDA